MRSRASAARSAHLLRDVEIRPQSGRGEEAGNDCVEPGGDGGAFTRQLGAHETSADHAEVLAQLGQVPAVAAKDADAHSGLHDGVNLAGDGENQGGLAAAVGAENRNVLAGAEVEVDVVQHNAVAARDVDVSQRKEFGFVFNSRVLCHRTLTC